MVFASNSSTNDNTKSLEQILSERNKKSNSTGSFSEVKTPSATPTPTVSNSKSASTAKASSSSSHKHQFDYGPYAGWNADSTAHYTTCRICGEVRREAHYPSGSNPNACGACGKVYRNVSSSSTSSHTHTFDYGPYAGWNANNSYHYNTCTICGQVRKGAHYPSGTNKNVCGACGKTISSTSTSSSSSSNGSSSSGSTSSSTQSTTSTHVHKYHWTEYNGWNYVTKTEHIAYCDTCGKVKRGNHYPNPNNPSRCGACNIRLSSSNTAMLTTGTVAVASYSSNTQASKPTTSSYNTLSSSSNSSSNGMVWPMNGYTYHTTYNGHGYAWDFPTSGRIGVPVRASKDGKVVELVTKWNDWQYNGNYNDSYGNYVKIYHPSDNTYTIYAHLTNQFGFPVSVGSYVSAGQVIGYSGTSGNSTGPHLHFEMQNGWSSQMSLNNSMFR